MNQDLRANKLTTENIEDRAKRIALDRKTGPGNRGRDQCQTEERASVKIIINSAGRGNGIFKISKLVRSLLCESTARI